MTSKCTCTGAICSCGAEGIVKDGHGVHRPAHMMDGATTSVMVVDMYDGRCLTVDQATWDRYKGSVEYVQDQMKHRDRHAYLGDRAPAFTEQNARDALADRVRQVDRAKRNEQLLIDRANDPTAFTKDGRRVADLSPSEKSRHEMLSSRYSS